MSNMSYCRFQNTLSDLQDCQEHLTARGLSRAEFNARQALVDTMHEMLDAWEHEEMDDVEFADQEELDHE